MLTAIKGEINSNTIIMGDFNTPLLSMERSSRQKIYKETQALSDILDHIDLIVSIGHSMSKHQNSLSSQVHMEHSPG